MPRVFVGVGSNIDRAASIRAAARELRRVFGPLMLSPVYETVPVGFSGDNFYNLVAAFDTEIGPAAVAGALHELERRLGRSRDEPRFAARNIDLDLLLYGDRVVEQDGLTLPRPDIERYAFVLRPLADIAGDVHHPRTGATFREMWQAFGDHGQELWPVDFDWGDAGDAGAEDLQ
jgi:2-amino-4-hydroxy-6-hydroxymethyldihydropteridine diphosphokinase